MIHVEPPRYPQTIMNKADRIAGQIDALQALREDKARILRQLHEAGAEIGHTTNDIFKPLPQAENRIFTFSNLVSNGLAVYQGIRMGSSFVHAVLSLFRKKRR